MSIEPRLDIIGAALADPSRSRILCELMDGRAFTNKELACAANITPQTATAHLKQLQDAGLTTSIRSGRHIYHRIANETVAETLEGLANLSPTDHLYRNHKRRSASTDTLFARCCYNHIAGKLGVLLTDRLVAMNVLRIDHATASPGAKYQKFLSELKITPSPQSTSKPVVKLCLDWTERRHHISGPLATALLDKSLSMNWLVRNQGNRALTFTSEGRAAVHRYFGIENNTLISEQFGL